MIRSEIHACAEVLAVINRVERAQSIVIVKHKCMLMCNHKIHINIMRCSINSAVRREIGQLQYIPLAFNALSHGHIITL